MDADVLHDRRRRLQHAVQGQALAVPAPRGQSHAAEDADGRGGAVPAGSGGSRSSGQDAAEHRCTPTGPTGSLPNERHFRKRWFLGLVRCKCLSQATHMMGFPSSVPHVADRMYCCTVATFIKQIKLTSFTKRPSVLRGKKTKLKSAVHSFRMYVINQPECPHLTWRKFINVPPNTIIFFLTSVKVFHPHSSRTNH